MRHFGLLAVLSIVCVYISAAVLVYLAGMHELANGPITGQSVIYSTTDWLLELALKSLPILLMAGVVLPALFVFNTHLANRLPEQLQQVAHAVFFLIGLAIVSALIAVASYYFYHADYIAHWGATWTNRDVFIFAVQRHTEWWLIMAAFVTVTLKYTHLYLCNHAASSPPDHD